MFNLKNKFEFFERFDLFEWFELFESHAFEAGINRALFLDARTPKRLKKLQGKTLEIKFLPIEERPIHNGFLKLFELLSGSISSNSSESNKAARQTTDNIVKITLVFQEQGVQFKSIESIDSVESIDAVIYGPLKAFLVLGCSKDVLKASQLGLTFEGELETIEDIKALFLSLSIDWEEYLSHWMGDALAHHAGQWVRSGLNYQKEFLSNARDNTVLYLSEEAKLLPTKPELNLFFEKVDVLRADVERLEARIHFISQYPSRQYPSGD